MFEIPKVCPICGEPTHIEMKNNSEVLKCLNPKCRAKVEGKILQFVGPHGLDIASISTATVRDLIDFGWVTTMKDIFLLKNHRDEWARVKGYGETSVDKILEGIPTSIELWKAIASAGIPNVEKGTAKLLAENFDTWEMFRNAVDTNYNFTKIGGIGEITANNILNHDYSEIDGAMEFLTIKQAVVGGKLAHLTFCITGKLSAPREEFVKTIEANGGKCASVGKGLDYLICNDQNSTSSKMKKAKDLGTKIISEDEFWAMI